ncbi:hypothetical protein J2785_007435, partial [Burkholderia ambifaria]|nr:hypothetical protein [Burkholderia ambifaria]
MEHACRPQPLRGVVKRPHTLKALFINDTPYQQGVSGQSQTYSDAYLELIFMFYRLFGWGMRQI